MITKKTERQHERMTKSSIRKLVLQFAAPTTLGMFMIALYTLADSYFVSHLGTVAGAAVGIAFPLQAFLQAVGYTLGMGGGSLISRYLGKKQDHYAEKIASISLFFSVLIGLLILTVGLLFTEKIMLFFGTTEAALPLALSYSRYLFISAPFMCAVFVVSQLLRAEGKAIWSAVGLSVGGLLNILLDPLFISFFQMGIAGASLATLFSQIAALLILLSAYFFHQSQFHLFQQFSFRDLLSVGQIAFMGLPSFLRQGLIVLSTILLNHAAALWGDAAITALSTVSRIFLLGFSLCLGIGQGMMPVAGYNYGFGNVSRVRSAYRFSIFLASGVMLAVSIPLYLFAPQLIRFFRDDSTVIIIGTAALRLQSLVFVLHGTITCTIMLLQAIGKPLGGTLLASARQGLFFLPLIFLLPNTFGIQSILWVQPLSDAITFLFAIPFWGYVLKHLKKQN